MTDMTAAPIQGTAPLSTSIDPGGAPLGTGGGVPSLTEPKVDAPKPEKAETAGDTLKAELTRIREEEAKEVKENGEDAAKDAKAKLDAAEKAEKPAKDEKSAKTATEVEAKADKGEPEKAATERAETDKSRQSEGQKYHEPPARFLPKAKEVWANVPHAVKGEIARITQEHEVETAQFRQSHERYEQFRKYDEIAKSNGRDFATDSLPKVIQFEEMMGKSPIAAIDYALREVGPKKADGSHLTLMDVVQYVTQNPQAYQQSINSVRQPQQQQRQPDPEVQALKQELQTMRAEQVAASIITPFAAANPRYHELQEDIAFFLSSGKIPASLSPQERLEAAYDMAVRINPTSSVTPSQAREAPAVAKTVPSDDAGAKSIRGAPTGQDPDEDDAETDIRKLLKREARKLAS